MGKDHHSFMHQRGPSSPIWVHIHSNSHLFPLEPPPKKKNSRSPSPCPTPKLETCDQERFQCREMASFLFSLRSLTRRRKAAAEQRSDELFREIPRPHKWLKMIVFLPPIVAEITTEYTNFGRWSQLIAFRTGKTIVVRSSLSLPNRNVLIKKRFWSKAIYLANTYACGLKETRLSVTLFKQIGILL
jgi:hypothetical protein